jgi:YesN/AraC family two-component response regulator
MSKKMKRIILLEDDPLLAIVQKKMLLKLGYDVIATSNSGEEGLNKIKSLQPDIIVSDQNLIGSMKGLEVIKALREEHIHTPAIILSGDTTFDHLKKASVYENLQPLAKPVDLNNLKKTLLDLEESANAELVS